MSRLSKCVEHAPVHRRGRGGQAGVRLEHCLEKMLLHKWTIQDKDFDIIIIKSERHHMARERSCTKTIKVKASWRNRNT